MKRAKTRLTALLVAALLVVMPLCGCAREFAADFDRRLDAFLDSQDRTDTPARKETAIDGEHACVDFSQMSYERPDMDELFAAIDVLERSARFGDAAVEEACRTVDTLYTSAYTQYSLVSIYQSLDVNDETYYDESIRLYDELSEADRRINAALVSLIDDGCRDALEDYFGEEYVEDVLLNERLYDDAAADLLSRDNELSLLYDRIVEQTRATSADGRTWSLEEILSDDSLSADEYFELFDLYCKALRDNVSDVFLEMVSVRNRIAETLGFDSYAEYRYLCYTRDYTPEDAAAFCELVKTYIVPLYIETASSPNPVLSLLYQKSYDEEATLDLLAGEFAALDPRISSACSYMREYHLYDIGVRDGKSDGGYTTYLDDYESPFLFDNFGGAFNDIPGLIHEMGHYASFYNNPGDGPLDLAEIDSQGMEMLMLSRYSNIYGDGLAGAAAGDKLEDMMYSLITGCMQDEFQRRVYEDGNMTMDEICALYAELNEEYGLSEIYYASDCEWTLVSHTFQSPLYYISYAVSAVPALEIWRVAREDFKVGKELYLSLYARDHDEDFLEVLADLGFADPFDEETILDLADALEEEIARTRSRHWTFAAGE